MSESIGGKALVIGSEGNIGSPLAAHLRSVGYEVLESDVRPGWRDNYVMADITHPVDLLPAFEWKPDVVFLLAATVGRMTCEQAAGLSVTTNIAGVNNVLQLCRRAGSRCVFFSSSEVYGPECDLMDDAASMPRPANRYALSKWMGEQLVEYEVRYNGLRAVIVRPCMLYSEDEDVGDHRSAMIRFASHLARGQQIEVHRGSARSWLHVADAVQAFEAAGRLDEYAVINVGHPDLIPTADLAEMIRAALNAAPELIQTKELPPQMTLIKRCTLERQQTLLGFEPTISIAEGVRRVCAVHTSSGGAMGVVSAVRDGRRASPARSPSSLPA